MPFKFHTFLVDEDDDLCKARPGSPPAFFSLPAPASPRICGNCMPAAAHQSSGPSREPLPLQQVITAALAKVKHQKSADKEALKLKDKKSAEKQVFNHHSKNQELTKDNLDDIIRRLTNVRSSRPGKQVDLSETEISNLCATSRDIFLSQPNLLELESPVKGCESVHVYVNDEPLIQVELGLLQSCPNPPKNLGPGHYWYDKVSGY